MKTFSKMLMELYNLPPDLAQGGAGRNKTARVIRDAKMSVEWVISRINASKGALDFLGSQIKEFYDKGNMGLLFELRDGNLLKLTVDKDETHTSQNLQHMEDMHDATVKIHRVAEFIFTGGMLSLYLILMEKIAWEKLEDYLNNNFPDYDQVSFAEIIESALTYWDKNGYPQTINKENLLEALHFDPTQQVGYFYNLVKSQPNGMIDIIIKAINVVKRTNDKHLDWTDYHSGNFMIDPETKRLKAIDFGVSNSRDKNKPIQKVFEGISI